MDWQNIAVAAIGVCVAVHLAVGIVRRLRGRSRRDSCCGCGVKDCPSRRRKSQ